MTAKSMTGFGEISCSSEFGLIVAEIRSTNNRFLDITIKLPEQLKKTEYKIREIVSRYAVRGKIEVRLSLQPFNSGKHSLKINKQKVDEIIALQDELLLSSGNFKKLEINDILKWPGVIKTTLYSNILTNRSYWKYASPHQKNSITLQKEKVCSSSSK